MNLVIILTIAPGSLDIQYSVDIFQGAHEQGLEEL